MLKILAVFMLDLLSAYLDSMLSSFRPSSPIDNMSCIRSTEYKTSCNWTECGLDVHLTLLSPCPIKECLVLAHLQVLI